MPTLTAELPRRIHCVGVGGSGVAALARMLVARGHAVSGSDGAPAFAPEACAADGIRAHRGHDPAALSGVELLIRSAAVPDDDPEVAAARAAGVPVLKYSEALGRVMAARLGVAVAGTHGKTTVTALLAHLLREAGADPGWLVGGTPRSLPAASAWGSGAPMVVEACEYDRSFLNLRYRVGVVTGVAPDHLDCFGDERGVRDAFVAFAARVPADGALVLGAGVPEDLALLPQPGARVLRVGVDLRVDDALVADVDWRLPGAHNRENLAVALLAAQAVGVGAASLAPAAASFAGVARRLEDLGAAVLPDGGRVRVVDDFAHHPDELDAALESLRARHPGRRLVCAFQPHQASRTEQMLDGLARSLAGFDAVLLFDVFLARDPHPERAGALTAALAAAVAAHGAPVARLGPAADGDARLLARLVPGDVCAITGAGDIDGLAGRLARAPAGP